MSNEMIFNKDDFILLLPGKGLGIIESSRTEEFADLWLETEEEKIEVLNLMKAFQTPDTDLKD